MKKRTWSVFFGVLLCIAAAISACSATETDDSRGKETTEAIAKNESDRDAADSGAAGEIIEESDHHRIIRADSLYYCYFYNNDHEVIKEEGPLGKQPRVTAAGANLLRFTLQAGTGIGSRWGYYYDTENAVFSEVFQGICDERGGKAAYIEHSKVVVCDIFDSGKYCREFSEFSHPLSEAAAPIINAIFSEDGERIIVSYLTGEDYKEVTEEFPL